MFRWPLAALAGPAVNTPYDFAMRASSAARGVIKWGGPLVALALAGTWWSSGTRWIAYISPGDWEASAAAGRIAVSHEPGLIALTELLTGIAVPRGLRTMPVPRYFQWWFNGRWNQGQQSLAVPIWFPFAVVVAISAVAWRIDIYVRRRARIGHFPACNYNRMGLADALPCPECGTTKAAM